MQNAKTPISHELHRFENDRISLLLSASTDNSKLFLEAKRNKDDLANPITKDEIILLLSDAVDLSVLHPEVLENVVELLNAGKPVPKRRIGQATPPVKGRDGRMVLLVKPYEGLLEKNGAAVVDSKFDCLFDNIEKGSVVARIYPPESGHDGIDVRGNPITHEVGKEQSFTIDERTLEVREPTEGTDFKTIVAKESGFLVARQNVLVLNHLLVILENIGMRTGDIEFIGSVIIEGNVEKDFSVTARGDIEINGSVQGGALFSREGAISVRDRVTASEMSLRSISSQAGYDAVAAQYSEDSVASFRCAGSFSARMAHHVSIEAGSHIFIEREAHNCSMHTGASVHMPRGHLLGGIVKTTCGVEADIIGSAGQSATIVDLNSELESHPQFSYLTKRISRNEEAEKLLHLYLGPYGHDNNKAKQLTNAHRQKIDKLCAKLEQIEKTVEDLKKQQSAFLENACQGNSPRANFLRKIYPGVTITSGESVFVVKKEFDGPGTIEFDFTEKKFVVTKRKALESDFDQHHNGGVF